MRWFLTALMSAALFGGCGKKPPQDAPPPPGKSSSLDNILQQPGGSVAAPPSAPTAAPPISGNPAPAPPETVPTAYGVAEVTSAAGSGATTLKGGELATDAVVTAYNARLARVIFELGDWPMNLEQLKKWPRMPKLPTAPPGKRIAYDEKSHRIYLTN